MKHLGTSLAAAAGAALAAAAAVLWLPSLPGKAVAGAALAYWLAHSLRRHKLARKGSEAVLAGTGLAVAVLALAARRRAAGRVRDPGAALGGAPREPAPQGRGPHHAGRAQPGR